MAPPFFVRHGVIAATLAIAAASALPRASTVQDGQAPVRFGLRKTETPHLVVTTSTSRPDVTPGTRISLFVDVTPKPKMHVYAPDQKEYIPVSLSLESDGAYKGHLPVFPKAETYFFEPLQETQLVYSKPFRIVQDVTVLGSASAGPDGALRIKGTLRYQACDDKVCYMPRTLTLEWAIGL